MTTRPAPDLLLLSPLPTGDDETLRGFDSRRLRSTRYVEVRRRLLREQTGHALDGWPLPAD